MIEEAKCNDSSMIIAQALDEIKKELGNKFNMSTVNLAELERRTGISRAKLRRLKENDFVQKPHGNCGKKAAVTVVWSFSSD